MVVEPVSTQSLPLPRIRAVPRHIAIIMDGNGRWAAAHGLQRQEGHQAGANGLRTVIERMGEHGVEVLSLFAFSTENWGRPVEEVSALMELAVRVIDRDIDALDRAGARLLHIGELSELPVRVQQKVREAMKRTAGNDRITVNLAFNYGGRADIAMAVRRLIEDGVPASEVTEEAINSRLATAGLPDPDLLIRTGGERRISNFLVWQAAYAEYYFTTTQWPNFGAEEVDAALIEYSRRRRRFGLIDDDGVEAEDAAVPSPDAPEPTN